MRSMIFPFEVANILPFLSSLKVLGRISFAIWRSPQIALFVQCPVRKKVFFLVGETYPNIPTHKLKLCSLLYSKKLPEYPSRAQVTSINVLMAVVFPALLCAMEGISVVMVQMRPAVVRRRIQHILSPSIRCNELVLKCGMVICVSTRRSLWVGWVMIGEWKVLVWLNRTWFFIRGLYRRGETLSETRLQLKLENSCAENEVIGQIEVKTWQHFLILYLVKKL